MWMVLLFGSVPVPGPSVSVAWDGLDVSLVRQLADLGDCEIAFRLVGPAGESSWSQVATVLDASPIVPLPPPGIGGSILRG